jgi:hypothetical protein
MITDKELMDLIDDDLKLQIVRMARNYDGQYDDLSDMIGTLIMTRLFGWKVSRLCASSGQWEAASKAFGDLKLSNPEEGPLASRSLGYAIVKKAGDFWSFIKRHNSIPRLEKRRLQ